MTNASDAHQEDSSKRLQELEATWSRKFMEQPKLPSAALLTGAIAMALGFGAIVFFSFAWATNFRRTYTVGLIIFTTLSLCLGIGNRILARRWFEEVKTWSAERKEAASEIERLKKELGSL